MTRYIDDYENGTAGDTPPTTTTAPGPFSVDGTVVYDGTHAAHGVMAVKLSPAASNIAEIMYGNSSNLAFNSTSLAVRGYFYLTAAPGESLILINIWNSSNTKALVVGIDANNHLFIRDNASNPLVTGTVAVTYNQWFRIEAKVSSPGTTGAHLDAAIYAGDSLTSIDNISSTAGNTGTGTIDSARFGKDSYGAYATPFWLDDVAIDTDTTSFIGPFSSGPTPLWFRRSGGSWLPLLDPVAL